MFPLQPFWVQRDLLLSNSSVFFPRYLARVTDTEATDTSNPKLNYGIMVDCGSSGSRIFVYWWPRHNGNPHDLLDIKQMRDKNRKPVVMKIKPGTRGSHTNSLAAYLSIKKVSHVKDWHCLFLEMQQILSVFLFGICKTWVFPHLSPWFSFMS